MRATIACDIVGQLVVVGVAVVQKSAFLHHQPTRVYARPIAAIPTERPLADGFLQAFDRELDMTALLGLAQFEMLDPAPAMAADVVARGLDRSRRRRIALESQRAGVDRQRQIAFRENPMPVSA